MSFRLPKIDWKALARSHFIFSLSLVTLVFLIGASVLYFRAQISETVRDGLAHALQTVLRTSQGGIRIWERDLRADISSIVAAGQRRLTIEEALKAYDRKDIKTLKSLSKRLDNSLAPWINEQEYLGYVVLHRKGKIISSILGNRFQPASFPKQIRKVFAEAFADKLVLTPPFDRTLLRPNVQSEDGSPSVMLLIAPVRNSTGDIIAVFGLFLDPTRLTELTQLGRMGRTGETYAVDRYGRMLTETRFDETVSRLIDDKLEIAKNPFLRLRDPGGNLLTGYSPKVPAKDWPLTKMASSIAQGYSGMDLEGYRDYRGVLVVGAWTWDPELEIGLATEIDVSEAYKSLSMINRLSSAMIASLVFGSILSLFLFHLRTKALNNALASEKVAKARQELLATVSHDLKNPLNAILLHDELLLRTLPDLEGSGKRKKSLESLKRAAEQMRRLIEDLLLGAKLDAGSIALVKRSCPIEWISTRLLDIFGPLASEKGLTLIHEVDPVLHTLWVDPSRVLQVLSNLVGNAIKFTPKGGTVTIRIEKTSLHEILISVSDNGLGIAPSELEHVFDRYWQSASTSKLGTGLGLAISKQLVEAHGGRIWAESAHNVGTSFFFTIPFHENPEGLDLPFKMEEPEVQSQTSVLPRIDQLKVLVADDSADGRDLFGYILQSAGAVVTTAEDGESAVREALAGDFDVVLMDLQMPGMGGLAAAKRLRELGYTMPVVALSATAPETVEAEIAASGFNFYLCKPISRADLIVAVSKFAPSPAGQNSTELQV